MVMPFHDRYRALVAGIETDFPVDRWRDGDVDVWPLARTALYLDLYRQEVGPAAEAPQPTGPRRIAGALLRSVLNRWRSRRDLRHLTAHPVPADAVLLGDGVTLDCIAGAWRDRFGEPLIAALEKQGRTTFLMQGGGFDRLPRHRMTFMANQAEARGRLMRSCPTIIHLQDHAAVMNRLAAQGVAVPSLAQARLHDRARDVSATASGFADILRTIQPRLAFVVNYFSGFGPAFVLACRRRKIPCIDLQRAPLAGAPMAYGWSRYPATGYATVPDLFWNWNAAEAARVGIAGRAFVGGHTQLAGMGGAASWNGGFAREILVALQPVAGQRALWEALADRIAQAPPTWRWWIRRHPASSPDQDAAFGRLLQLRRDTVEFEAASRLPLPRLLPHMSVTVSLGSGVAAEAALFGVPSLFLSADAAMPFSELIASGMARIVSVAALPAEIAALAPAHGAAPAAPDLARSLAALETMVRERGWI